MLITQKNTSRTRVDECFNLCPADGRADMLTIAPQPLRVASADYSPLAASVTPSDRLVLIASRARDIYMIACRDLTADEAVYIGQLPADPGATAWDGTRLTIMTGLGAWSAVFDDETSTWAVEGLSPVWPAVTLTADDAGEFTARVAPGQLSREYIAGGDAFEADRRRMARAIRRACDDLRAKARCAGAYIAPVIARARIVDAEGATVHVYPPTLLMPSQQAFDQAISFMSTDRRTLMGTTVAGRGFRIGVTIAGSLPEAMRRRAATLVVDATREFLPVDPDALPQLNFAREAGAGFAHAIPALSPRAITPAHAEGNAATIADILPRLDTLLSPAAHLPDPFAGSRQTAAFPQTATQGRDAINRVRTRMATTGPVGPVRLVRQVRPPHGFVARTVAIGAGSVLWGDITPQPFQGWSPQCYATAFEHRAWRGWAQLVTTSGHALLWQGEGDDYAPVAFSPLLSYPGGAMASITVCITLDGADPVAFTRRFTDSGNVSWSLDTGLKPIVPVTADEITPPDHLPYQPPRQPSLVLAAPALSPLSPCGAADIGARPAAILPSPSGGNSWDFGRERFYAFTPQGTRLLTLSADRHTLAANVLDSLAVTHPGAVAPAPDRIYILPHSGLSAPSGALSNPANAGAGDQGRDAINRVRTRMAYDQSDLSDPSDFQPPLALYTLRGRTLRQIPLPTGWPPNATAWPGSQFPVSNPQSPKLCWSADANELLIVTLDSIVHLLPALGHAAYTTPIPGSDSSTQGRDAINRVRTRMASDKSDKSDSTKPANAGANPANAGFLQTPGGLYCLTRTVPADGQQPFRWAATTCAGRYPRTVLRSVVWRLDADALRAEFLAARPRPGALGHAHLSDLSDLSDSSDRAKPAVRVRLRVDGAVHAPLPMRLGLSRFGAATLSVDGTADPALILLPPLIA